MPYTFAQRSRATGSPNEKFTNLVEFVDPGNGNKLRFEATDETLVWSGTTSPLYARSSEAGEIWPAVVEKAYAMWRGGTTHDHPDLTVVNGGDPVHASAALVGRSPQYTWTAGTTAANLLNLVRSHCVSYRTLDPMTAWTYGSGDDSPDNVNYADANLVASHAHSVLGWARGSRLLGAVDFDRILLANDAFPRPSPAAWGLAAGVAENRMDRRFDPHRSQFAFPLRVSQDYIVLRNPWGSTEATVGELSGVIPLRDVSFWRSIDLDVVDGSLRHYAGNIQVVFRRDGSGRLARPTSHRTPAACDPGRGARADPFGLQEWRLGTARCETYRRSAPAGVSLADHTSFALMRSLAITRAFAYDDDFARGTSSSLDSARAQCAARDTRGGTIRNVADNATMRCWEETTRRSVRHGTVGGG